MDMEMGRSFDSGKRVSAEGRTRKETVGQPVLVWLMLLCGFLYFEWLGIGQMGLGVALFTVYFCGAGYWYMAKNGYYQTKSSLFYLGLTLVSALYFPLFDNWYLGPLNFLFLSCMAVYWVCATTGRRLSGDLSGYIVGDLLNQLLLAPFGNFTMLFSTMIGGLSGRRRSQPSEAARKARSRRWNNVLYAALGLLVAGPVLLLVLRLLASADPAFQRFTERIMEEFHFSITVPEKLVEYGIKLVLGIPVACYLFGLLYGNVSQRESGMISRASFDKAAKASRILPRATCYAVVGALILIYVAFFGTQMAYLFSAFRNSLPVEMTYAQYARRGFFQLCNVAAINLVVIAGAYIFTSRTKGREISHKTPLTEDWGEVSYKNQLMGAGNSKAQPEGAKGKTAEGSVSEKAGGDIRLEEAPHRQPAEEDSAAAQAVPRWLRMETAALCLLTIMLIAAALSKMGLYIRYYGLTQLRFYTSWFMVVLLLVFFLIGLRQLRPFPSGKLILLVLIAGFLSLCYSNADGIIASYNIDRYRDGTLESLDVEALGTLSVGGAKAAYRLYQETEDLQMKARLYQLFAQQTSWGQWVPWQNITYQNLSVQGLRKQVLKDGPPAGFEAGFESNDTQEGHSYDMVALSLSGNEVAGNNAALGESIRRLEGGAQVSLGDLTPFDWDAAYTFSPYASKEAMEEKIGFSSRHIKETINEGMEQLIFVKDEKVVCSIYGYGEALGYHFNFQASDLALKIEDSPQFSIDRMGDTVQLNYIQPK